jgi:MMPL family
MSDNFLDDGLVLVRFPGNAPIEDQSRLVDLVDEVVARHPIPGVEALATGPPVLLAEINDYLQGGMATLAAIAVGVMVLVLLLVFRARWRLLPLAVVLVGAGGAFGAVGLAGIPLTLVTISGLLIGLGVDFAIQMHNRYEEERGDGRTPAAAADRTVHRMGPPLALAMVAAVVGFLALLRSRVPMVQDFGLLLVVGVVVLVSIALAVPVAVLVLRERRRSGRPPEARRAVESAVQVASSLSPRVVLPLVALGALVVAAGLAVEGGLTIQTDPERWVDQDGRAVTDLERLREGTGYSTELSILVEAPDVTAPEVAAWMQRFGATSVARYDTLEHATSMPAIAAGVHGTTPGGDDVAALLSVAPADVAHALVSADRTRASLVFPITNIPLTERERLFDDLVSDLHGDLAPPRGVTATPAGLTAVGIELVNGLEAGRRTLSLTALALVLAWLVLALRSVVRPVLVLVPVTIAVGALLAGHRRAGHRAHAAHDRGRSARDRRRHRVLGAGGRSLHRGTPARPRPPGRSDGGRASHRASLRRVGPDADRRVRCARLLADAAAAGLRDCGGARRAVRAHQHAGLAAAAAHLGRSARLAAGRRPREGAGAAGGRRSRAVGLTGRLTPSGAVGSGGAAAARSNRCGAWRHVAGRSAGLEAGRPPQAEPLDRVLSHLVLLNLAGDRHRELVGDLHIAGDLEVGDLSLAERPQRLDSERLGAVVELDDGHDLLAVSFVGDTDHLDVDDVGVDVEELLDLSRVHVLAAADDHVLDPPHDVEVAVVVHRGQIAGVHPPRRSARRAPARRSPL